MVIRWLSVRWYTIRYNVLSTIGWDTVNSNIFAPQLLKGIWGRLMKRLWVTARTTNFWLARCMYGSYWLMSYICPKWEMTIVLPGQSFDKVLWVSNSPMVVKGAKNKEILSGIALSRKLKLSFLWSPRKNAPSTSQKFEPDLLVLFPPTDTLDSVNSKLAKLIKNYTAGTFCTCKQRDLYLFPHGPSGSPWIIVTPSTVLVQATMEKTFPCRHTDLSLWTKIS